MPLRILSHCLFFLALSGTLPFALGQPFLYVTNQNSSSVSVVNTATSTVGANPASAFSPAGAALSPDGSRLFVACPNSNAVSVYNTVTNLQIANIPIGQAPMGVAVDNTRLYVTLNNSATLAVFNAATFGQQANLRVGFGPSAVAVSTATGCVYVANSLSNTVTVIDTTRIGTPNNPVIGTLRVPDSPIAIALSADGNSAWVLSSGRPLLARLDLASGEIAERIALPFPPAGLALSPDDQAVYVTGYGPAVVRVAAATGRVSEPLRLPTCTTPRCVAMGATVSADGNTLYVANSSRNQVAVIDTGRMELLRSIEVQDSPRAVVLGTAPRVTPTTTAASEEQN